MHPNDQKANALDVFIHRPVLAIVLALALVLIGLQAAISLPVMQFPRIESTSLVISTPYVGASAEVVQGFITDPIERVAATIPGVDYVDSSTLAGLSTVRVWLNLNEDSTDALAELSSRLSQIRFELPEDAEDPAVRVMRADRPHAGWYLDVAIDTNKSALSRAEITDYLARHVRPKLTTLAGVQFVGLEGGRRPAMRIWLDPVRMEAMEVSAQEVRQALAANNIISTLGRSENNNQRIDLLGNTVMHSLEDFERLVVREVEGAQIRLGDVARVELGEEEGELDARRNHDDVIYIAVWPLPGANEIEIADALYVALEQINPTLPEGLKINISYDVTQYMRSALKEIFITLIETLALVGIVVVAMMGSFRTALVPLVTIPISILGALAAMQAMGFSFNLLTVLAIVLSVGLVVDDAIVVVENVARHMREGRGRIEAALLSSRQLWVPIVGMTMTLAAVYAPIGFVTGLTGVLFKEFAFTLAVAVLISGVVAITLSPIMSAYACPQGGQEGVAARKVNRGFTRIREGYAKLLARSLGYGPQILFLAGFIALLIVPFYMFSQLELAPTEDQSMINVIFEAPPESSLDYTRAQVPEIVDFMLGMPGAKYIWQNMTPAGGFGGLELVGFKQREKSVHELLPAVYGGLAQIAGLKIFPILPAALPTAGNFDIEMMVLASDSPEEMVGYARQLVNAAYESGEFLFADSDLKLDLPQARFRFDREKIADLGMSLSDVSRQLNVWLSGDDVNRFDHLGKSYRVIPMIEDHAKTDPQAVLNLKLHTPAGDLVSVASIAELDYAAAPRVRARFQQKNAFRIFGGVMPGSTKDQALQALEAAAAKLLPADYSLDYAGESRQLRQEGNTMLEVLLIALVVVFLVLAVQFNSFRDPLVVLLGSVPLALSGALLFSFVGWTTINIYTQVGLITLVGLVAKNGILIVEFANHMQRTGLSKLEAIKSAAQTRLRPVLMTTGATVLGHFPLVLVSGAGAEARNSIGIILVAGMLIGTLFTLFVLPSIYLLLASTHSPPATSTSVSELTAAA